MRNHRNVTLRLPQQAVRAMIEQDAPAAQAKRRFLDRIRNAPDRGTRGRIRWTRAELHER